MVILLGIGLLFFTTFLYSALVLAKRADEYVYNDEEDKIDA